jgi:ABC-type nitrate/sulfonate/bicarbonate transport system permease component
MLIRLIEPAVEFATLFVASVAAALFLWEPKVSPRWQPALKIAMGCAFLFVVLSEFLLKDLTGKGWQDRAS